MSARGRGRGGRAMTPHGVTIGSVLTPVSSMPSNNIEQNSSPAPLISESAQPNVSLTPANASVTKNVHGKTKGLALAKVHGGGKKEKLGFSRTLGQPKSENNDDLTRFTVHHRDRCYCFAICPFTSKRWEKVPGDAKDSCI
ncbi:uncharacterized protein LOC131304183 [Rhododendron vialii]|uniref:uncharacterized protein LOC131304183 n=1 Tax=Rhododendron vialii TaxID=182163 RepID=UPI00265DFFBF|nr:uncharacterized protein LOC131304183 [Rhododendron vialii]